MIILPVFLLYCQFIIRCFKAFIFEISTNKKRLLTVVLLPSYTTILKSLILIRPFISLHKNGEGLFTVVLVLEASLASSTGKFETKARILGMRHRRWLLPSITTIEKSFEIKSLGKYLPLFLLGQLQCISDHVFQ